MYMAKQRCLVLSNDLNPRAIECLRINARANRVSTMRCITRFLAFSGSCSLVSSYIAIIKDTFFGGGCPERQEFNFRILVFSCSALTFLRSFEFV